jgi:hypothetical protein
VGGIARDRRGINILRQISKHSIIEERPMAQRSSSIALSMPAPWLDCTYFIRDGTAQSWVRQSSAWQRL